MERRAVRVRLQHAPTVGAGLVEHFDRGFQMDTAFINRVGLTRTWRYGEVQFYPDRSGIRGSSASRRSCGAPYAKDRVQNGTDPFVLPGIRFNFTRAGNLRVDLGRGHETFAGQRFPVARAITSTAARRFCAG